MRVGFVQSYIRKSLPLPISKPPPLLGAGWSPQVPTVVLNVVSPTASTSSFPALQAAEMGGQGPRGASGDPGTPCTRQDFAVFSVNLPQVPVHIPWPPGWGWCLGAPSLCLLWPPQILPCVLSWALTASPAANQELPLLKQLQRQSLERDCRFQSSELCTLSFPMFSSLPMFLSPHVSHSWVLTERWKGFSNLSDGCGFFFFLEHPN